MQSIELWKPFTTNHLINTFHTIKCKQLRDRSVAKKKALQSSFCGGNLKRCASRNRGKVIQLSLLFPRSSQLVYHRFKPRAFAVNCTPHCIVMPDGDIAFARLATANQCAGNWPSNGLAQCVYLLCTSFFPVKRKVFERCFTGVQAWNVHVSRTVMEALDGRRFMLASW